MEEKETKKKKKTVEEEVHYEKVTIKDYKFTIILLLVITVFTFATPWIFKGVKKLEEMDLFGNLFSKGSSETVVPTDDDKDDEVEPVKSADKSGANEPILKEGMIPVRYNYIENVWVKADSENPAMNGWYNYGNKEWANAILVRENGTKTREFYENANADTVINNEDILAFFVWIPRYKYSIVSSTGMQQVEIAFEESTATKSTGPNYITHPAFTFDGKELSGIWVGKFEITGNMNNVTVLPNQGAIVSQNISTMFNGIQGMYGNLYGLNTDDSNLRLIKNTEWGAVTYLANSKYGICKNSKCEVMTSYNYDYSSDTGIKASTTGNITGVYAMSGGAMEYVMGNNNGVAGSSGFDNVWMSENKKYYDSYTDGTSTDYTRGINGDATEEFGPFTNNQSSWNSGYSSFVDSNYPWFFRDIESNIYSFSKYTGGSHYQIGFRISLS